MANGSYDLRTAIFLAAVCGQTYLQYMNKDGLFLLPSGFMTAGEIWAKAYDGRRERFGFILESDNTIVVAFRGTSSAIDWISDFIARQEKFKPVRDGGLTHKGFTDIYMSARDELLGVLNGLSDSKRLYVTGHSLGGALATLAAPDIALNTPHIQPAVYTFAAPRVGDPRFVSMFNSSIPTSWRIWNVFDIVPQLPPLIYRSPKTEKTYFYLHVKGDRQLSFRAGSVPENHAIGKYFAVLTEDDPHYSAHLCSSPPSWCPAAI